MLTSGGWPLSPQLIFLPMYSTYCSSIARFAFCLLLLLSTAVGGSPPAVADTSSLQEGIALLAGKSFREKTEGAEKIGTSGDLKAAGILSALADGRLFFTKKDSVLVIATETSNGYDSVEVLTDKQLGGIPKRELNKITINNSLRGQLKALIARINLGSGDSSVRLAAIRSMYADLSQEQERLFVELLATETNDQVQEAMTAALALTRVKNSDPEVRRKALVDLRGNLDPTVRNEIVRLLAGEQDPAVLTEAKQVLAAIETEIAWYAKLETVFFGLSLGSVLVLAAIGLAITFGVIGVINMAHGELIMIGAYTTYVIQELLPQSIGLALALSIPAAFCVSALVGIAIERSVIRFLYGRPLETLLATFGISLILQQTVRTIFSPLNRSVATPDWMSGSIMINPVLSLTTNRVTIFFFAMLVFGLFFLLLKKTSIGLQVRAVSQNRVMARAMGVRAARVDALTFGLGSGIAGIAGVALSQLTNVGPNLGQAYIVDSFMVVVFGGVGNLWGTLLGGLSLGIANKFLEPWSGAVLAKIIILVCIILFIQKRPQGLFPQRGRATE